MSEAFIKSDMIHLDAEDFPFVLARGVDGKTSCVVWVRETPSGPQLEGHLPHKLGPGVEQQWHRRDVILTGDWWDYTECIFKCFYAAKAANTACDDPAWVRWILSVFAGNVGWKRICVEVTAKHLGDVRRPQIDQAISDSFIKKQFIAPHLMAFAEETKMILNRLFEPFTTPLVKKFLLIFAHIPAPDEYRLPFILPTATSNRPPASNVRVIFVSEREIRERVKAYTVKSRGAS